jgi:hypothetical protein
MAPFSDAEPRCPKGHRVINDPVQAGRHPVPVMWCPTCNTRYRKQADGVLVEVRDLSGA